MILINDLEVNNVLPNPYKKEKQNMYSPFCRNMNCDDKSRRRLEEQ